MLKEGYEPIPGYRLVRFLGRGQFGEVWKVKSPGGTFLAFKFLNLREKQGRKEFRAIQKVKGIRHPNLVQTYALWLLDENGNVIDEGAFDDELTNRSVSIRATMIPRARPSDDQHRPSQLIIATVLCDKNLMERMEECGSQGLIGIPPLELLAYLGDAAKAIDFLNAPRHDLGDESHVSIHHCDIKPENIMLLGDAAIVGDFGVARILQSGSNSDVRATSMGGTIAYGAPESFDNKSESTSDQYALAITYYELRVGKLPFPEVSQTQVALAKQKGSLDFSLVGPAERSVLAKATSVIPSKRFTSAKLFVESLEQAHKADNRGSHVRNSRRVLPWIAAALLLSMIGVSLAASVPQVRHMVSQWFKPVEEEEKNSTSGTQSILDLTLPPTGEELYREALTVLRKVPFTEEVLQESISLAKQAVGQDKYRLALLSSWQDHPPPENDLNAEERLSILPEMDGIARIINSETGSGQHLSVTHFDKKSQVKYRLLGIPLDRELDRIGWLRDAMVVLDSKYELWFASLPLPAETAQSESLELSMNRLAVRVAMMKADREQQRLLFVQTDIPTNSKDRKLPKSFELYEWKHGDTDAKQLPLQAERQYVWREMSCLESDAASNSIFISDDQSPRIFCAALVDRQANGTQDLTEAIAAILKNVSAAVFLDKRNTWVVAGQSVSGGSSLCLVSRDGDKWLVSEDTSEFAKYPFTRMIGSGNGIDAAYTDEDGQCTVLHGVLHDDLKQWMIQPLSKIGGLNATAENLQEDVGTIECLQPLNENWLLSGHSLGAVFAISLSKPGVTVPVISLKNEQGKSDSITKLFTTQEHLIVQCKSGRVIVYDKRLVQLIAETCSATKTLPRPPETLSLSVDHGK